MPTVSIIMPVYNVEKYIKKAIISILNQSFDDFELIIVNDGTTDKSIDVVNEYYQKDSRIVLINKSNGGLSDARNIGMRVAKGEYILFVDSDDEIESKLLEITVRSAKLYDSDIVMFGMFKDYIDSNEQILRTSLHKVKSGNYDRKNFANIDIDLDFIDLVGYVCNKLYKKKIIIEKQNLFETNLSLIEDIVFNTTIFELIEKLTVLEEPLYHYKQRKRTTLVNKFRVNIFELYLRGIECRRMIMLDWGINDYLINEIIAQLHVSAIKSTIIIIFTKGNQLSLTQKRKYISNILRNPITNLRIKQYKPKSIIDHILKFIIYYKMTLLFVLIGFLVTFNKKTD